MTMVPCPCMDIDAADVVGRWASRCLPVERLDRGHTIHSRMVATGDGHVLGEEEYATEALESRAQLSISAPLCGDPLAERRRNDVMFRLELVYLPRRTCLDPSSWRRMANRSGFSWRSCAFDEVRG
jgi:hypothetical protein